MTTPTWDSSLLIEPSLLPAHDELAAEDGRDAFVMGAECCMWYVILNITGQQRVQRSVRRDNLPRLEEIANRAKWLFETAEIDGIPDMVWIIATRVLEDE
jgi:hypothetical protein